MSIVPETGRDGQWLGNCLFINMLNTAGTAEPSSVASVGTGVWGRASRPSSRAQLGSAACTATNLALSGERQKQGRSRRDPNHGQPCLLHRFFDSRLVRPHPGVFGIVLRRRVEQREAFGRFGGFAEGHLQNFGEVEGVAVGFLGDLLAATKTVGDDEPVGGSLADGGQEFEFADGFRNLVFFFFEAERSSHAAASGRGCGEVDTYALQHSFLGGHLHDGLVMAMSVNERSARQFGKREILCALFKKFAEQEDLFREGLRAFVFGEKVSEFVAENGGAAGFEDDDRRCGFDFREKLVHDLEEQALGAVEHADVVERAPAAEVSAGNGDGEAGGFEDFDGGAGGRREEVIVESVGPEEDGSAGVSPA